MNDWRQDPPRADVVGKEIARLDGARSLEEQKIADAEKTIEDSKNEIRLIDRMLVVVRAMETTPAPPKPGRKVRV